MPHRFLDYLNDERDRLNRLVTALTADGRDDGARFLHLRMLTLAVERQVAQWASDLLPRQEAGVRPG